MDELDGVQSKTIQSETIFELRRRVLFVSVLYGYGSKLDEFDGVFKNFGPMCKIRLAVTAFKLSSNE